MKAAYDQRLVGIANKVGKPFGAKVGRTMLDAGEGFTVERDSFNGGPIFVLRRHGTRLSQHPTGEAAWTEAQRLGDAPVHSLPITESMRSSVTEVGQPLFSVASSGGLGIEYEETSFDKKYSLLVDAFHAVGKLQDELGDQPLDSDVRTSETLFHGALTHEQKATRAKWLDALKAVLGDKVTMDQADEFFWALHAEERNKTAIQREDVIRKIKRDRAKARELQKAWDNQKRLYDKYNEDVANGVKVRRARPAKPEGKRPPTPKAPKVQRRTRGGDVEYTYPTEKIEGWDHEVKPASGMRSSVAREIVAKHLEGKDKRVFRKLREWNRGLQTERLEYLRSNGLISQGLYDAIKEQGWQDYVPLRHVMRGQRPLKKGQGYSSKGDPIRRFKGRVLPPDSPMLMSLMQLEEGILMHHKAKVGRALLALARKNEDPGFWKIVEDDLAGARMTSEEEIARGAEPGVLRELWGAKIGRSEQAIQVVEGGKLYHVVFSDRGTPVVKAMKKLDASSIHSSLRTMGAITRWYAAMNTSYNPAFSVRNFIRDILFGTIAINAEHGKEAALWVAANTPAAIRGLGRHEGRGGFSQTAKNEWSPWIEDYNTIGARTGWYYGGTFEDQAKNLRADLEQAFETNDPRKKAARVWSAFKTGVDGYNSIIENGVRLASFRYGIEKLGMTKEESAVYAKNLTVNFNRKGSAAAVMGPLYMFYNASVQGTLRGAQVTKNHPATGAAMVAAGFLQSMLNYWMAPDDDDGENAWRARPEFKKDTAYTWALPDGSFISMPLPYWFNSFFTAGRKLSDMIVGGATPGEMFGDTFTSVLSSASPVGGLESGSPGTDVFRMALPTVFDPFFDTVVDEKWTGAPISPGGAPFDRSPGPDAGQYWALPGLSAGAPLKPA